MSAVTEEQVVNLPCSVPNYVKRALYEKVQSGKRSEYICGLIKKDLGLL